MQSKVNPDTPIIFSDGTTVYDDLAKQYLTHDEGFFILAPSGAGKSYFVNNQPANKKHWIDGDLLWPLTNADPTGDEWEYDFKLVQEVNDRCDIITTQAKKLGFWITGSSNNTLRPDAIVLPPWDTHKSQIRGREDDGYDGGAVEDDLSSVLRHREWIAQWETKGVPRFDSLQAAADHLSNRKTLEKNS